VGQVRSDEPVTAGASSTGGGVVLRLGAARYVVALEDVAEVVPLAPLTRVPNAPAWLAGVANWRGRLLPVVDLRLLLEAPAPPLPTSARFVVLTPGGSAASAAVAVLAEAVPGVHDGALAPLEPLPPTVAGPASALLRGQLLDAHGPLGVLDAAAVLALRDRLPRGR
jgi:chemotaxis signal transduction protein